MKTFLNHLLGGQFPNGGFGHQRLLRRSGKVVGLAAGGAEAYWCCSPHVARLLGRLARRPLVETPAGLCLPFLLPCTATLAVAGVPVRLALTRAGTEAHLAPSLVPPGLDVEAEAEPIAHGADPPRPRLRLDASEVRLSSLGALSLAQVVLPSSAPERPRGPSMLPRGNRGLRSPGTSW